MKIYKLAILLFLTLSSIAFAQKQPVAHLCRAKKTKGS